MRHHLLYLGQRSQVLFKDETADCIEDTATLHSKHITWQSLIKKVR